ncbi:MAG: HD domain-containing phosphohydrolase [candidate division KSB1 bacterium]|jgi:HD-GYP domain-containing protein (c-di-GMP phosphodiesterase class II)|nr:HD domain-containing phosphohydrolase [candidate division KSB1 bacterium]
MSVNVKSIVNELDQTFISDKLKFYQEEHRRLTVLFNITRNISTELNLDRVLLTLMDEVKKALMADRCTVFLLDRNTNEIWSKVAHGEEEIRFPSHLGIAGYVATTGEILNIPDAYADSRFNPDIDRQTGYLTKNMLTFPMRNKRREIIGVFQVLNKYDGIFTKEDEQLLDAISVISAAQLENAQLYEEQKETFESFIETLASTIDARDPLTAGHSHRIARYADAIAEIMNIDEEKREIIKYAALLHDYGKIAIREAILTKRGRLTVEEYKHIKEHPAYTKSILEKINFSENYKRIPLIAAAHHERMDGTGYPDGMNGSEIPIESRILAVADVFDALTSKRHYRDRMKLKKVMHMIQSNVGTHFDTECVGAFEEIRLDKLILILEESNASFIDIDDLKILSKCNVKTLLENQGQSKNGSETIIEQIFNKYYSRNYSK